MLSLRIEVPMPKGRGISVPFSFSYDSNSVRHFIPVGGQPGFAEVVANTGYLSQGGWRYAVPMISRAPHPYAWVLCRGRVGFSSASGLPVE